MKCPKCGKKVPTKASKCRHCGVKFVRKSETMVKKMTMDAKLATATGGALLFIGIVMVWYKAFLWGGISAALGCVLMYIGKKLGR